MQQNQQSESSPAQANGRRISNPVLIASPIMNLMAPGLVSVVGGRSWRSDRLIGLLGLLVAAVWYSTLGFLAFAAASSSELFLTLITTNSFLLWIEGLLVAISVALLWAGAYSVWHVSRSDIKKWAKTTLVAVLVLSTATEIGVTSTATGYVQSQRELLSNLFVMKGDLAEAASLQVGSSGKAAASKAAARVNILLLGGDAGKDRWGLRADSISVLSVNAKTGKTVIIGIPRNMQKVPFPSYSPMKTAFPKGFNCGPTCLINAVYTYATSHPKLYSGKQYAGKNPGVEATREAAEGVLGIKIPYVITTDMTHFSALVNAVGGITVCVPKRTLAQDHKTVFPKGCQRMNGAKALLYSRTRYDADDYHRMLKQRLVQKALIGQISPIQLALNFQKVARTTGKYVSTNIPAAKVGSLLNLALKSRKQKVRNVELTPPKFNMINPNFKAIKALVQKSISTY